MGNRIVWTQIDTSASYHTYYRRQSVFSEEIPHIFCTFLITCIVFPRFVWYFRLRRTDLNINGSARLCMLSTTLMHFFLLKRANNHSRPLNQCYPFFSCLLNTIAAIPLRVTHDKVAAIIISEPLMQMITT